MKTCVKCSQEKEKAAFPKHSLYKDNLDTRCRECISRISKIRRELHKRAPQKPDVCDCCHKASHKTLCLDHDHETGAFRGWICDKCNTGIGKLGDSCHGVLNAVEYLLKHELSIVGGEQ